VRGQAIADLAEWYEDGNWDPFEREEARDHLIPAVDDLARIAKTDDMDTSRWNAVLLLGEMGRRALSATDALIVATREPDPALRKMALSGLERVASPHQGIFRSLRDVVRRIVPPDKRARLEKWDPAQPERAFGAQYTEARDQTLPAVLRALRVESSSKVIATALATLGSWGPKAAHLTKDVLPYLEHESRDVRQQAVYTLRSFKAPANLVMQPFIDFIRATERDTLRGRVMIAGAIIGLGELGADGIEAVAFLRRLAGDERLKSEAEKAIAKIEAQLSIVEDPGSPRAPDRDRDR